MNVANSNHYYYVVFGLCWCGIHFNFLFKWLSYKKKVCYSDFLEKIEDWVMCVCVHNAFRRPTGKFDPILYSTRRPKPT